MFSDFDSTKIIKRRSFLVIIISVLFSIIIVSRLFFLQVLNGDLYKKKSKQNRISTKITPPMRGDIFDSDANLVAGTISTYSFIFYNYINKNYKEELIKFKNTIYPELDIEKFLSSIPKNNSYNYFFIKKNVSWAQIVKFETNKFLFSSIKIIETKKRHYPNKNFSQLIGYIAESDQSFNSFPVGIFHIEKYYNKLLKGSSGKILNEVNAYGKIIREISVVPPSKGSSIQLTINSKLQNFSQKLIPVNKKGSIVIMKVADGSILSLNSNPTFNSQNFEDRNSTEINSYFNDLSKPMLNRAFSGFYPPGSVFKTLPALLALEKNLINENTSFYCNGHTTIDGYSKKFHCWKKQGHGKVNLKKAIKESCDVFFFELAKLINIDDLSVLATEMGYNQKYSIGLSNEQKGLIPNKKWKKNKFNESWGKGDNLNTCIGQGFNQVSPLQLAVHYNSIIHGGIYPKPKIIKSHDAVFQGRKFNPVHQKFILEALNSVVNEYGGTANKLAREHPNYIKIAGKTGTSQVIRIKESERENNFYKEKVQIEKFKDHSVFVGYGPVANPKYIASIIIENGGSGSSVAAPLAHEALNYASKLNV